MLQKTHFILWLGMLVFLLIAIIFAFWEEVNNTIDIQLHDTYFVIARFHLVAFFVLILGLLGLVYWLVDYLGNKPFKILSFIHIIITYVAFFGLLMLFVIVKPLNSSNQYINNYSTLNLYLSMIFTFLILIFLIGQFLFLINLIISIFRR